MIRALACVLALVTLGACAAPPPPAPSTPSIAVCDDWGSRKLGECADALARAPVPRNRARSCMPTVAFLGRIRELFTIPSASGAAWASAG